VKKTNVVEDFRKIWGKIGGQEIFFVFFGLASIFLPNFILWLCALYCGSRDFFLCVFSLFCEIGRLAFDFFEIGHGLVFSCVFSQDN